jgi:hypothetical protein
MKEFVAMIVLSMPILAVLCIGGLAGFAGWAVARHVSEKRNKWLARVAAASAVVLVFVCDEIAGRFYLRYLCATEGGIRVNKQIRLPPEFWRANGTPIFLDEKGNKIGSRLDNDYQFGIESNEHYSRFLRIRQYVNTVSDKRNYQLLGTYTHFSFFGGWLVNWTSLDIAGVGCPSESKFYSSFLRAVFTQ